MTVRVNLDADNDLYELGDDVDGVFIAFASVPGAQVRGRIETIQATQETPAAATTTAPAEAPAADTGGGGESAELEAANARIAELEARLAGGGGGGGGQ